MLLRTLQSCSLRRSILFQKTRALSYHVVIKGTKSVYRRVLARAKSSSTFKQFTITSSKPSITRYEDVISQIPTLHESRPSSFGGLPAIIVLITPSFTTWLEDETFISKLLETIFVACSIKSCLNISALFAVVDGLPPNPNQASGGENQSAEGLAIMFGDQEDCLPELWQIDNGEKWSNQFQLQPSSLLFKIHQGSVVKDAVIPQLRVPLANTMFYNGRISTLIVSSWQRSAFSTPFQKTQHIEKRTQQILPSSTLTPSPKIKIPLAYLTPPRRIVSGLGNIVRQVMGKDDTPVSASQELEASIDFYLKRRGLYKQTLAVWALVTPGNEYPGETDDGIDSKVIEADGLSFENGENPLNLGLGHLNLDDYIGYWLKKGASLHRVLSGGGGWGLKQGLISLDPDTGKSELADAGYDPDSFENEQVNALGNIARLGSWIQFLVHDGPKHNDVESTSHSALLGSFALGSIPSTLDNMPPDPAASANSAARPVMRCFDGHFGAQSEKGIYIYSVLGEKGLENLNRTASVVSSKIDVPYTTFWWPMVK